MQLLEWDHFETTRLLKGLLRVASFMHEPLEAPVQSDLQHDADAAHKWKFEDAGDLCCLVTVDTEIVKRSVAEPEATGWLYDNSEWIQSRFGCALNRPYTVADVIRALRAALTRVGIPLVPCGKKTIADSNGGAVRTVTSWTLVSPRRDSMLELAYSDSRRHRPEYSMSDWNVAATLNACPFAFRWHILTGVERPADWPPVDLAGDDQSEGMDKKKKRKRKSKNDIARAVCPRPDEHSTAAGSSRREKQDQEKQEQAFTAYQKRADKQEKLDEERRTAVQLRMAEEERLRLEEQPQRERARSEQEAAGRLRMHERQMEHNRAVYTATTAAANGICRAEEKRRAEQSRSQLFGSWVSSDETMHSIM